MADATQPTRRCPRCGIVKPIASGFYRDPRKRYACRVCLQERVYERLNKRVEFINNYKLGHGCADCGYNAHPHALEFDHRPGEDKFADITKMRLRGTMQQLIDEMKKCDVVCANCHRLRTADRRDFSNNALWDLRRVVVEDPIDLDEVLVDGQLPLFGDQAMGSHTRNGG